MAVATQPTPAGASSSLAVPAIRVLDTTVVLPSTSPSSPGPPESSLPLTFFDVFWLSFPPVERLFVYRLAPDADVDAILTNLKTSLSTAIRAFYPLAVRLRVAPGTADRYELHYRPGDGVAFTVAECDDADDDLDTLATDDAREVARIAPFLPSLPEGGPVLALQATVLSGRRALALGVAVHHSACDGAGSTHFLHTWAAAAAKKQAPAPPPPVIDRSLIADPGGLYGAFYKAAPTKDEAEFVKMSPDQLLATFVLSKDDLQRVKDAVAAEAGRRGVATPPRCSSFVAALGLVWSCYHRAKKEASCSSDIEDNAGGDGRASLVFAVDHRSRMKPPLPETYLGNCVGPAFVIAPRDELAAPGAGGLFSACAAVAASIQEAVSEFGTPAMDVWMERVREASAMRTLSVAGSPRFRVYEMDFGFGTPTKVDIVSVARTGAVAVAESRREAGGLEVGVSLQPRGMDMFHKCFADAMAWLHAGAE
ncbi:hypothetical protein EJB05_53742, partial [Eragrostis curvula]